MGYSEEQWLHRLSQRTDLSSYVTHLTRATDNRTTLEVLLKILKEANIKASSPREAFIVGDRPAVCFQEAPPPSICQNVYFEQKYREQAKAKAKAQGKEVDLKVRYRAFGLMFYKPYVYAAGGRPVIYDQKEAAKKYLPEEEWWRIVSFNLSNPTDFIDWTHEREWRVPGDFSFELSQATVVLTKQHSYKKFVAACKAEAPNILDEIAGIVVMENILY